MRAPQHFAGTLLVVRNKTSSREPATAAANQRAPSWRHNVIKLLIGPLDGTLDTGGL